MASLANKLFGGSSKESSDGQALNWHQPEAVAMMHANELANTGYGHDHVRAWNRPSLVRLADRMQFYVLDPVASLV